MPSIYVPDATNTAQPADTDYAYLAASELRTLKTYLAAQLAGLGGPINGSVFRGKNLLLNGSFNIDDMYGYAAAANIGVATPRVFNRWRHSATGTSTVERKTFTAGEATVPGLTKYLSFVHSVSGGAAADILTLEQRIEGVGTAAGTTVTLSFWAKAAVASNISIEFVQSFGSGGTPSADVTGIGVSAASKIAIGTSWTKCALTVAIPSIAGKTIGTSATDYLAAKLYLSAGTTYDSLTNNLGVQLTTIDIAAVQLEYGNTATLFDIKSVAEESLACARYTPSWHAESGTTPVTIGQGSATSATSARIVIPFKTAVRSLGYSFDTILGGVTFKVQNGAGTDITVSGVPTFFRAEYDKAIVTATVASGLTAGQHTILTATLPGANLFLTGAGEL